MTLSFGVAFFFAIFTIPAIPVWTNRAIEAGAVRPKPLLTVQKPRLRGSAPASARKAPRHRGRAFQESGTPLGEEYIGILEQSIELGTVFLRIIHR
jgi:hypothetical protein